MANAEQVTDSTQASNSKAYLELEQPVFDLRYMTVLLATMFNAALNTEHAKMDGDVFLFRVPQDHFHAMQLAIDDIDERTRKMRESF